MKKILALILALAISTGLCACAKQGEPTDRVSSPTNEALNIKTLAENEENSENTGAQGDIHAHGPVGEGSNSAENTVGGYCGNIQTTVKVENGDGNIDSYTFMAGDSVTLTDILINLKYDKEEICKCMPEFTVETELGGPYGVNLTEMYARCSEGQAALTAEQAAKIKEIYDNLDARHEKDVTGEKISEAPGLTVSFGGESIKACVYTHRIDHMSEDGNMVSTLYDCIHPLDNKDGTPVLKVSKGGTAILTFDVPVMVESFGRYGDSEWGNTSAASEEVEYKVINAKQVSVYVEPGYIYELNADWQNGENNNGGADYCFCCEEKTQ